ncbi:MAG: hypothetical protein M0Z30_00825 [Actinomycetota bacterium]|nr:hypothetical protein [Actinomycetota bacterium]
MALVMTLLTVLAMLGGTALLLWFTVFMESRHLGPLPGAAPATVPAALDQAAPGVGVAGDGAATSAVAAPLRVIEAA